MGCLCCKGEPEPNSNGAEGSNPADIDNRNRGCTDIIVLILFILFWIGLVYIGAFAVINGQVIRLIYGTDSSGNVCGRREAFIKPDKSTDANTTAGKGKVIVSADEMDGLRYLFFMDPSSVWSSKSICVKKCPDVDLEDMSDLAQFAKDTGSKLCDYGLKVEDYTDANKAKCPKLPLNKTQSLLFRCIPSDFFSGSAKKILGTINKSDLLSRVMADFYTSRWLMLLLCVISFVLAGLIIFVLRFLSKILIWVIVIAFIVGSVVGTAFLWWSYATFEEEIVEKAVYSSGWLSIAFDSRDAFFVYSIIATVVTVVLLILIIVMRSRLNIVGDLFAEAGKCLIDMPFLLIQPLWTFLILVVFFAVWSLVMFFISTADEVKREDLSKIVLYIYHPLVVKQFWWYHLIGLIWTAEFIAACQQLVVAGAVSRWYFTKEKSSLSSPICRSICTLMGHHLGSAAFGAFILTLVRIPRCILLYIEKKTKGTDNSCAQFCLRCCHCCLKCLDCCLRYLNYNAYTVIAIEGSNFCSSAKKAFTTLVNNALRVAAMNSVGDFLLFLAKIAVTGFTIAVGILIFRLRTDLHYYPIPVFIVAIFAYFVAHVFLSVYEMVIDTLLLCFCHDVQVNKGTTEQPLYAQRSLYTAISAGDTKLKSAGRAGAEGAAVELKPNEYEHLRYSDMQE